MQRSALTPNHTNWLDKKAHPMGCAFFVFVEKTRITIIFTCGDNVMNSLDSRYWGFVPEEYIVGVVDFIPYSIDKNTDESRWDRILKSI